MTARLEALAERTAARLLATMGELTLTQAEMATHANISNGPISSAVRLLRERKQIYIASYRCTDNYATAAYKLGNLPDAEKPPRNAVFLADAGAKVLELLATGDKSTKEIGQALNMNRSRVHDVMVHLRDTKQVHVVALAGGLNCTHIYRAGAGKDAQRAPRPVAPPKARIVVPPIDPLMAAFFGRAA